MPDSSMPCMCMSRPMTLGDAALPWLDADTVSIASLVDRRVMPLGPDVFMEGYVHGID